jgi:hypothetical protein
MLTETPGFAPRRHRRFALEQRITLALAKAKTVPNRNVRNVVPVMHDVGCDMQVSMYFAR